MINRKEKNKKTTRIKMKLEKANGRIHTQRTNKMFLLAVATAKQKAAKMTQQKKGEENERATTKKYNKSNY